MIGCMNMCLVCYLFRHGDIESHKRKEKNEVEEDLEYADKR